MSHENEVNSANQIFKRAGRTRQTRLSGSENIEHGFGVKFRATGDARVMATKSMQAIRIRRRDERFAEFAGYFCGLSVGVQRPFMKMADFNPIETVDFLKQPPPD